MDFATELAGFNPDPALAEWLTSRLESLSQKVSERDAELGHTQRELELKRCELERKGQELKSADLKIQALTFELARHKRIQFSNKSEAFSPEQRVLFQETWDIDFCAIEAEVEQLAKPPRAKRERAGRQALPAHLPRIEYRHEPDSCTCGQCGKDLVKIGEDITEQLDVEPARFSVIRHIRPQYACRACETVTAAPIPPAVIDGGLASPGLLTWVMISKYIDHLPLYRIEQIAEREQVILARSTQAEWVGRCGVALQPLADRLVNLLRQRAVLHADETPVPQLDPGRGKTKRAYLWAYRSNNLDTGPPIIVFDFQPGRSGQHARDFLGEWRGSLMVDDYAGYKALFGNGITELACLVHCRRKFHDLYVANKSVIAEEALRRIRELYAVEEQGRGLDVAARLQLRQQEAKPKLAALRQWLIATRATVANGGATAKAIDYSLKRWTALLRYADSGSLPIDNNPVENNIRPIALGKKNWLFAGSERAGKRAAAIQSLLGTAKLNGLNPYAWLKDTLEKLPIWPNSRIDELLPFKSENDPTSP